MVLHPAPPDRRHRWSCGGHRGGHLVPQASATDVVPPGRGVEDPPPIVVRAPEESGMCGGRSSRVSPNMNACVPVVEWAHSGVRRRTGSLNRRKGGPMAVRWAPRWLRWRRRPGG